MEIQESSEFWRKCNTKCLELLIYMGKSTFTQIGGALAGIDAQILTDKM